MLYLLQPLIQFRSIATQRPTHDLLNVWPTMCASLFEVPLYGVAAITRDSAISYGRAQGNHSRYHESLGNLTPADVYFGRGQTILNERRTTKEKTMKQRRLINQKRAA